MCFEWKGVMHLVYTLLKSLREQKKVSLFTILLSVLEAIFEIIIPLSMANLIDYGIEEGSI